MRGGAFLKGKEGRVGFQKRATRLHPPKSSLNKKGRGIRSPIYLLSYSMYLLPYSKPSSEQRFAQCLGRIMLYEA